MFSALIFLPPGTNRLSAAIQPLKSGLNARTYHRWPDGGLINYLINLI